MAQSNVVPKSFLPGKKDFYNLPSTVSAPPIANAFGATPWQLSGVFTTTVPILMPGGITGSGSIQTVQVPISDGWPSPIVLKPSDLGSVSVFISLAQNPANWLIGTPEVQMQWGAGTAITANSGASQFTLSPGTTYAGPVLNIKFTGYLTTPTFGTTGLFTVQAHLYGRSES